MPTAIAKPDWFLRPSIVALGASTAVLQTLAIREGLNVASGNEAVIALLFGVWMTCTAAGAALGRAHHAWLPVHARHGLVAYGVLIPMTLLAARASTLLLEPGTDPSLPATTLAAAALLGPACACSGWIYARLARAHQPLDHEAAARSSARAYWLDTLGSGVAGAALALFALDHVLPFRLAALAAGVIVGAAAMLADRRKRAPYLVGAIALAAGLGVAPVDAFTYRWLVPGHAIVDVRNSSRGVVLSTLSEGQFELFVQRDPVLVPSDTLAGEQVGLLPAALHPAPRRTLFLGIPPGDALAHLLAHPLAHVDVVVGDPTLAQVVGMHAPGATDPRATIHPDDERSFARSRAGAGYDLIIVHGGAPTSVASARLVSSTFFADLARALDAHGVIVVTAAPHAAYATEEQQRMHASYAASLRAVFAHLQVLPADWTLYVASHESLPNNRAVPDLLSDRMRDRGVHEGVVTATWLQDRLSAERIAQANLWAAARVAPSTDTHPHVFRNALDAALAPIGGGLDLLLAIALCLAGLLVAWVGPWTRPVSYSVATTGFAGLALQLVVMLVYQTAVGALYRDVALVTAAFMGASCLGTWWASRRAGGLRLRLAADGAQLAVAVALALAIPAMALSQGALAARATTIGAAGAVGLVTGAQVAWASRSRAFGSGVAGSVFAIDLVGASLAALVTLTFVVPAIGLAGACWAVAGLKATSFTALAWKGRTDAPEDRALRVPLPVVLLVLVVGAVILPTTERFVVALSRSSGFRIAVLVTLGAMLLSAFQPKGMRARLVAWQRRLRGATSQLGLSPLQSVQFLILLPVAALPLGRCFFSVPFLFCHVCPNPCVFGVMRPYVITAALLGNLGDRQFCERVCPHGLAQASAWRGRRTPKRTTRVVLWLVRLALLAVVVFLYVRARETSSGDPSDVFVWFYAHGYATPVWALVSAGLLLGVAFAFPRPFCEGMCPIGAVSELIGRLEQRWVRSGRGPADQDV